MKGAITIGQVAQRTAMLDVACRRCTRRGRVSMARLMREHGGDAALWEAFIGVNDDCPNKDNVAAGKACSIYWPQLSALFPPADQKPTTLGRRRF